MSRSAGPKIDWSDRERQVLDLIADGHTNGEIAETLGISFATAKWHVSELITKLGVSSREEVAEAWRRERGLPHRIYVAFLAGVRSLPLVAGVAGVAALVATAAVVLGPSAARGVGSVTASWPPAVVTPTSVAPQPEPVGDLVVGQPFPNLAMPLLRDPNQAHYIWDYTGRPVVVVFWTSWCGPCTPALDDYEVAHQQLGDSVVFLGASRDAPKLAQSAFAKSGVSFDTVIWPYERPGLNQNANSISQSGLPLAVFVDADGIIRAAETGWALPARLPADFATVGVDYQVAAAPATTPPPACITPILGCRAPTPGP